MMKVYISNNAAALAAVHPDVTVEAEYGEVVVPGLRLTMAHHGPRAGSPAPCSFLNGCAGDDWQGLILGISHVDLDTIGGIMAVMGCKPRAPRFWDAAVFVDLNGAHKLVQSDVDLSNIRRLHAYWAFSRECRVYAPRDGTAADVTEAVLAHVDAVRAILEDDEELLQAGDAFAAAEATLNVETFRGFDGLVILRASPTFANHLYATPDGKLGLAVVNWNPGPDYSGGAITLSLADPVEGVHCGNILRELFGPEAGGHQGIGGSPRGAALPYEEAVRVADEVARRLAAAGE